MGVVGQHVSGYDHLALPVEITSAQAGLLLTAARSGDCAVYGDSTRTAAARTARDLADLRCVRYLTGHEAGWEPGMWAAYLTCAGWNALWRHHGDTHVDQCGQHWQADGRCGGCGAKRYLDLQARNDRLATLTGEDLERETVRSALWCPEHGFVRAVDVQTDKVCRWTGSTLHDGGLNRLGRV